MRYAFILNPAAQNGRAGRHRAGLEAALRSAGLDYVLRETEAPGHAAVLAREAAADAEVVVAVGGDGTIQEVACGVYGTGATLGVLPLGTGNDFAHAVGMPDDLGAAVRALLQAPLRDVDLGRVEWTEHGAPEAVQRSVFANCLGVGFDALVARNAQRFKFLGGRAAYHAAVFRTLWSWRQPAVEIAVGMEEETPDDGPRTTDGGAPVAGVASAVRRPPSVVHDGRFLLVEIGNGFSVGGGFLLTPEARVDDGLLDVCVIAHASVPRVVRLLPTAFTGAHVHAPEVTMHRGRRVTLRSAAPLPVQADGEVLTADARTLDVAVLPGALRVLAPHLHRA